MIIIMQVFDGTDNVSNSAKMGGGANTPLPPSSTGPKIKRKSFVNQLSGQKDFRFRTKDQKHWGSFHQSFQVDKRYDFRKNST